MIKAPIRVLLLSHKQNSRRAALPPRRTAPPSSFPLKCPPVLSSLAWQEPIAFPLSRQQSTSHPPPRILPFPGRPLPPGQPFPSSVKSLGRPPAESPSRRLMPNSSCRISMAASKSISGPFPTMAPGRFGSSSSLPSRPTVMYEIVFIFR